MNWIRPYLAVGPLIGNELGETNWETLLKNNVTCIIDLNDEPEERSIAESLGFRYYGIPIEDPPLDEYELIDAFPIVCNWIVDETKRHAKIYLHCTGGSERSPTFAAAYLIYHEGSNSKEAMEEVRKHHPMSWGSSPYLDLFSYALEKWDHAISGIA